jgi:hypothetical protein
MVNLAFEISLFTLRSDVLHAATFCNIGSQALLPLQIKVCCGLLSPLKIYRLGRV